LQGKPQLKSAADRPAPAPAPETKGSGGGGGGSGLSMMDELANSLGRRRTAITGSKGGGSGGGGGGGGGGGVVERVGKGSSQIQGLGEYMKSKNVQQQGGDAGSSDSDWD